MTSMIKPDGQIRIDDFNISMFNNNSDSKNKLKAELKELIKDWLETARNYRKLAELDRVKQRGASAEHKHYAHMIEACADELEVLINGKEFQS